MSERSGSTTIAVLGATTTIGRRIAEVLVAHAASPQGDHHQVLCVGPKRVAIDGATWRIVDLLDPALPRKLAQVDTVVLAHLDPAVDADRSGVVVDPAHAVGRTTDAVMTAVEAVGVQHVVLMSSAMVVGARASNHVPLPEDHAPQLRSDGGLVAEWVHAEQSVQRWADADADGRVATVLRPAMVVGPGIDTELTRHFEAPRVAVIDDDRPPWALAHLDDVAEAAAFVVAHRAAGTFAVASPGLISQQQLLAAVGKRAVRVPSALALGAMERLHRVGISAAPADDLGYLRYPWVLDAQGLARLGWTPTFSTEAAMQALAEQIQGRTTIVGRRVGRSEAASLGAAGAGLALLGAAAVVRARRQRGA